MVGREERDEESAIDTGGCDCFGRDCGSSAWEEDEEGEEEADDEERNDDLRLESIDSRLPIDIDTGGVGGAGGGGSYPGCCTPRSHIGSVHLSGVESVSRRYLTALSRCPFP
jgi:hypothetical protein